MHEKCADENEILGYTLDQEVWKWILLENHLLKISLIVLPGLCGVCGVVGKLRNDDGNSKARPIGKCHKGA